MADSNDARILAHFISSSPSVFHVVANAASMLEGKGFVRLDEKRRFALKAGQSYYIVRNSSSLIAFRLPARKPSSMHIIASHTDSPTFRLKPSPVDSSSGKYSTLNVEAYGGSIYSSWFDRPLSVAGREFVKGANGPEERLVDFSRDLVQIPSLAIHQRREANDGVKISVQKEMMPLVSTSVCDFSRLLADTLAVDEADIIDTDLFLYNRTPASFWGADGEFFSSPRLDDLMCAFSSLRALLEAEESDRIQLVALFDNEEVGSSSRQGALSDFLSSTVERILFSLGLDLEERAMLVSSSFLVSADNGHAMHPNYTEKCDITNRPVLNGGVLLKYSGDQKYSTDAYSASRLISLMEREGIPYQKFANNSDIRGGSTLGSLSLRQLSLPSADVGCAQLAMHSSYETAGVEDASSILRFFKAFLEEKEGLACPVTLK